MPWTEQRLARDDHTIWDLLTEDERVAVDQVLAAGVTLRVDGPHKKPRDTSARYWFKLLSRVGPESLEPLARLLDRRVRGTKAKYGVVGPYQLRDLDGVWRGRWSLEFGRTRPPSANRARTARKNPADDDSERIAIAPNAARALADLGSVFGDLFVAEEHVLLDRLFERDARLEIEWIDWVAPPSFQVMLFADSEVLVDAKTQLLRLGWDAIAGFSERAGSYYARKHVGADTVAARSASRAGRENPGPRRNPAGEWVVDPNLTALLEWHRVDLRTVVSDADQVDLDEAVELGATVTLQTSGDTPPGVLILVRLLDPGASTAARWAALEDRLARRRWLCLGRGQLSKSYRLPRRPRVNSAR
jgi:hypothetical protein